MTTWFKRKAAISLVLMLVSAALLSACAPAPAGKAEKTVKVGMLWDMTGPVSMGAEEYVWSYLSYARYLNEEKSGIQGRKLEVLWSDTGYMLPRALAAYNRFKEQGIVAMQAQASHEAVAMRPLAERDRIPVQASGSVPEALYPSAWVYVPENVPFSDQFAAYFSWIKQTWKVARPPRVAIIGFDNAMGRAAQRAEKLWKEIGIDVVVQEYVPVVSMDYSTPLAKVSKAEADFLWLGLTGAQIAVLLRQAKAAGIPETTVIAVPGHNLLEQMVNAAGPFAEGFVQVYPARMVHETDVPGIRLLREKLLKYYGRTPSNISAVYAWIDALTVAEAVNRAAKEVGVDKLDGPAVKAAYDKLTGLDTGGITAPISFGPDKRRGTDAIKVYQVKGGKVAPISDWITAPIVR